jgi:hypothetical protein
VIYLNKVGRPARFFVPGNLYFPLPIPVCRAQRKNKIKTGRKIRKNYKLFLGEQHKF